MGRAKGSVARFVLGAVLLVPMMVSARTNLPEKLNQLKENVTNSKINLSEYEKNLAVVESNLKENERALKDLARLGVELKKQNMNTAKGKGSIDANRKQLESFLSSEREKVALEAKQLEELKKTLTSLELNQQKRQANIAQYEGKLKAMETEQLAWSERSQSSEQLDRDIREKQALAQADHQRLAQKKATYSAEVEKWRKQVRLAERQNDGFKNLKD